jgi:hypothetical protein
MLSSQNTLSHDYQSRSTSGNLLFSVSSLACVLLLCIGLIGPAKAQESSKKSSAPPAKNSTVPVRNVLVFPTDTKGGVSDQVADDIVNVVESRLGLTKIYAPVEFLPSIPTVKLAISEQTLTQADVKKPFDSDSKLKKLSGVTGYDLVLVSSIDDYEYDSAKNVVSVVMSARLIDYSGAKAVVRSAAQSATSSGKDGNAPEIKVATELVRSLMDKLMTAIITPKPTTK